MTDRWPCRGAGSTSVRIAPYRLRRLPQRSRPGAHGCRARGTDSEHKHSSIAANLLPHLLQSLDGKIGGMAGVDEGTFPGLDFGHGLRNLRRDRHRDGRHPMLVAVNDVPRFDHHAADFHWGAEIDQVHVGMGYQDTGGEAVETMARTSSRSR